MSKQEGIREGIGKLLPRFFQAMDEVQDRQGEELLTNSMMRIEFGKVIEAHLDIFLNYLHSQGVVIKVKCPDCVWNQFGEEAVGMTPCRTCDSTGYIVEPLIKE